MFAVYAYTDEEQIIYIGMTNDVMRRGGHHKCVSPWWTEELGFSILSTHADVADANAAERAAILEHRPAHNIVNNPDHMPARPRSGLGWTIDRNAWERELARRGWTAAHVARLVEVSGATISNVVSRKRRASSALAHRLAAALGVEVGTLFPELGDLLAGRAA